MNDEDEEPIGYGALSAVDVAAMNHDSDSSYATDSDDEQTPLAPEDQPKPKFVEETPSPALARIAAEGGRVPTTPSTCRSALPGTPQASPHPVEFDPVVKPKSDPQMDVLVCRAAMLSARGMLLHRCPRYTVRGVQPGFRRSQHGSSKGPGGRGVLEPLMNVGGGTPSCYPGLPHPASYPPALCMQELLWTLNICLAALCVVCCAYGVLSCCRPHDGALVLNKEKITEDLIRGVMYFRFDFGWNFESDSLCPRQNPPPPPP